MESYSPGSWAQARFDQVRRGGGGGRGVWPWRQTGLWSWNLEVCRRHHRIHSSLWWSPSEAHIHRFILAMKRNEINEDLDEQKLQELLWCISNRFPSLCSLNRLSHNCIHWDVHLASTNERLKMNSLTIYFLRDDEAHIILIINQNVVQDGMVRSCLTGRWYNDEVIDYDKHRVALL